MAACCRLAKAKTSSLIPFFSHSFNLAGNVHTASKIWFNFRAPGHQRLQEFKSFSGILGVKAAELHGVKDEDIPKGSPYACPICARNITFTFKDVLFLAQFITREGYMINRRVSGVCRKQQRQLEKQVKIAQRLGILPNIREVVKAEEELKSK